MTDATPTKHAHRPHHWRRDLIELAALFTSVAIADVIAQTVVHGPDGPVVLGVSAMVLIATVGCHIWWARRQRQAPPAALPAAPPPSVAPASVTLAPARPAAVPPAGPRAGETVLWRMRTTVREAPGSLAALCTALAERDVDVLALQTHPLSENTVDEFLLRVPAQLPPAELVRQIATAGGSRTWLELADTHDLVDAPTRMLTLATRTALDSAELPLVLRTLLGRCTIRSSPTPSPGSSPDPSPGGEALTAPVPVEGVLEENVMRLHHPSGGSLTIERLCPPFTPAEFARARALVELDARLGRRVTRGQEPPASPEDGEITMRHADLADLDLAREMHRRCSAATLRMRYHGPVSDADRYLDHLLNPRFGHTLAAQTASGQLVALGHLLWDGDEAEVSLLVEDTWQRRGIGGALLRQLTGLATEAGYESVYAVTRVTDTGMVTAMRALGLPLDYLVEKSILVLAARLDRAAAPVDFGRQLRSPEH